MLLLLLIRVWLAVAGRGHGGGRGAVLATFAAISTGYLLFLLVLVLSCLHCEHIALICGRWFHRSASAVALDINNKLIGLVKWEFEFK